jgi:hypothetical protein
MIGRWTEECAGPCTSLWWGHRSSASGHLGPLTGASAIGFGREGRPFCVEGPYDDADRIMRTLQERVGVDGFHFLTEVPLQAW